MIKEKEIQLEVVVGRTGAGWLYWKETNLMANTKTENSRLLSLVKIQGTVFIK